MRTMTIKFTAEITVNADDEVGLNDVIDGIEIVCDGMDGFDIEDTEIKDYDLIDSH